jgi:hypothetical protein
MDSLTQFTNNFNQPDPNWLLQGRVIPASVTGTVAALYLQTRHRTWEDKHFHTGHCNIPAEVALEIAMTICVPFSPKLLTRSYDFSEYTRGLYYTHMVKVVEPHNTVAFITVTGLTALIELNGIDTIFRCDTECDNCKSLDNQKLISDKAVDRMLEGEAPNERTH